MFILTVKYLSVLENIHENLTGAVNILLLRLIFNWCPTYFFSILFQVRSDLKKNGGSMEFEGRFYLPHMEYEGSIGFVALLVTILRFGNQKKYSKF
jgi:hypothetical protein